MAERYGLTISDTQVQALLRLFQLIDQGGDTRVIAQTEPVRRFRASLVRIANKERRSFGEGQRSKLSDEDVATIRRLSAEGMTKVEIAKRYSVTPQYAGAIINGRRRIR